MNRQNLRSLSRMDMLGTGRSLLLLWDVDGTLISDGGVSEQVFALAYERVVGRRPTQPVITDGQTDPAILRSLLERHGVEPPSDLFARAPELMSYALDACLPSLQNRGRALPGAMEAIAALGAAPGIIQSVLTGNIAQNAIAKLAAFGLTSELDFEVGGFGSDHEMRSALVGIARHRANTKYGTAFDSASTVLVGDTPRDVEAGRTGGARVVAVASGRYGTERLLHDGASAVLKDLRDTSLVRDVILAARDRVNWPPGPPPRLTKA